MSDPRRSFYQVRYAATGKPAWMEDMGHILSISGILLEGMGTHVLVITPGANFPITFNTITPTIEDWCELLRNSDNPRIYEQGPDNTIKAIHRKVERSIGGSVQQMVWRRDGYQCMYCGAEMGTHGVVLSADHWIPVDLGGADTDDNLITACRMCNKRKGNRHPREFCESEGLDFDGRDLYLHGKCTRSFILDNHKCLAD